MHGRRALQVGRHEHRLAAALEIMRASLPQVVVLPEPCRPHIIRIGQIRLQMQRVVDRAHQVDQLVVDDADNLLSGRRLLRTCSPTACSLTRSMNCFTTGKLTSASSSDCCTRRRPSRMLDSVSRAFPLRVRSGT